MLLQSAIVVITHLLLPLFFICWVAVGRLNSRISWLLGALLAIVYLMFLHRSGGWFWVGTFWPWLFWLLLAGALLWSLRRRYSALPRRPTRLSQWLEPVISLLVILFLGSPLPAIFSARDVDTEAIALQFPLASGRYHIIQGGNTVAMNHHYPVGAQRYALDIVKTAAPGWRARGLYPRQLDAYYIWGEPVLAPCSGEVIAVESQLPDLPPPQTDANNVAGNHVAVVCQDMTVVLGHLQSGSVAVSVGDRVTSGSLLGRVGNSGNTSEPHLHIHAVRGKVEDRDQLLFQGQGVPMTFEGHFLIRNDRM